MLELIAILHPVHFAIVWAFAKKDNILSKLKRNYAIMYLDWFFIILNFCLVKNGLINTKLFVLGLFISSAPTIYLKLAWRRSIKLHRQAETTLFFERDGRINNVGIVHTIFMILQGSFCLTLFFSPARNAYFILGILSLLAYLVTYCIIIKYIRKLKLTQKTEMPLVAFALVVVMIRLIFAYFELYA